MTGYYPGGSTSSDSSRWTTTGSMFSGDAASTYRPTSDQPDQGPLLPTFLQQFPAPTGPAPQTLACEFKSWTGCDRRFEYSELDDWITHEAFGHMRNDLPAVVRCRLCDVWVFDSALPRAAGDRQLNFDQRMRHMAQHLRDRDIPLERWRPDFDLVKHVYRQGQMNPRQYKREMDKTEAPLKYKVPHDFEPPEVLLRQERSSRAEHDLRREDRELRGNRRDRDQHRHRRQPH